MTHDDMNKESKSSEGNLTAEQAQKLKTFQGGPQDPAGSRELSFGEKRVGISFNPSKLPEVDEVKRKHAFLINYMKSIQDDATNPEVKRLCAESMTQLETACMFAVKALTYSY